MPTLDICMPWGGQVMNTDSFINLWLVKCLELLVPYRPRRHLRSEAKGLLDEPRTGLKFGDRAFSIGAPRLWNALPQHLKDSTSCQAFKKCLKTHLFRLAHWGVVDYYSNYDNVQRFWTFYEWKRRYINSNYYYYYYKAYCVMWWGWRHHLSRQASQMSSGGHPASVNHS